MKPRVTFLVLIAALAALPLVPATPEFWITQLNYIGLAALVSLGLVLLTGVGGLTSFGQAAFVGIGAYATAVYTTRYGGSPWIGLLIGSTDWAWRFHRRDRTGFPGITCRWVRLPGAFRCTFLFRQYGVAPASTTGDFRIDPQIFRAVAGIGAQHVLSDLGTSAPGGAGRPTACSIHAQGARCALKSGAGMAESFGVDTARYKVIIFVYAALLASLSGWLFAHMQQLVSNPVGLLQGISYLFMAVVGGAALRLGRFAGVGGHSDGS